MKVVSTNIGNPTRFEWKGRTEETGIFKYPANTPISLGHIQVEGDTISDRRHHGGENKACYLFASDNYPYWQARYPDLPWNWGMFGENITLEGMDETELLIGSVYRLGDATVQITIPREPCYKLGVRFGDQKIIDEFVLHGRPGTYVRVLEPGKVEVGAEFKCIEKETSSSLSIAQLFSLLYEPARDGGLLKLALDCQFLPERTRDKLARRNKKGA